MPLGDSMVKDFAECVEFYGEHERLGIPPIAIARYLIANLAALTDALRALPVVEEGKSLNAGATPCEEHPVVDAQTSFLER
jgi:hypothetical protein